MIKIYNVKEASEAHTVEGFQLSHLKHLTFVQSLVMVSSQ